MEDYDFNKALEDLKKGLQTVGCEVGKVFNSQTAQNISDTITREKKKLEIKGQIGLHQRAIAKAYQRIGEAYYKKEDMKNYADLLALLDSNHKLIEMLNQQLEDLTK